MKSEIIKLDTIEKDKFLRELVIALAKEAAQRDHEALEQPGSIKS